MVPWWFRQIAAAAESSGTRKKSCILLWMNGGPSQIDTFDPKPGHENGGPFRAIDTNVAGIQIGQHLPKLAKHVDQFAIVRSMSTKEGDHTRAREQVRCGYVPQGPIQFPVLGSIVANEFQDRAAELPRYVSILPQGLFRSGISPAGFLGPDHAPLLVEGGRGDAMARDLKVENIEPPSNLNPERAARRLELMQDLQAEFLHDRPSSAAAAHLTAYEKATRLMSLTARKAFDLAEESAEVREAYGRNAFGQGCLLARRLVEREVPFVEVNLGGWDTHIENFELVERLCGALDAAYSTLLSELHDRGLLDSTLVVWMGEFGRTPVINPRQGRDHYPKAWSVVLGGGGIRGGQVIGATSGDGMEVKDRPVSIPDLLSTICLSLGLDPKKQNMSNVDRPIRLVDPSAEPITQLL